MTHAISSGRAFIELTQTARTETGKKTKKQTKNRTKQKTRKKRKKNR